MTTSSKPNLFVTIAQKSLGIKTADTANGFCCSTAAAKAAAGETGPCCSPSSESPCCETASAKAPATEAPVTEKSSKCCG